MMVEEREQIRSPLGGRSLALRQECQAFAKISPAIRIESRRVYPPTEQTPQLNSPIRLTVATFDFYYCNQRILDRLINPVAILYA